MTAVIVSTASRPGYTLVASGADRLCGRRPDLDHGECRRRQFGRANFIMQARASFRVWSLATAMATAHKTAANRVSPASPSAVTTGLILRRVSGQLSLHGCRARRLHPLRYCAEAGYVSVGQTSRMVDVVNSSSAQANFALLKPGRHQGVVFEDRSSSGTGYRRPGVGGVTINATTGRALPPATTEATAASVSAGAYALCQRAIWLFPSARPAAR